MFLFITINCGATKHGYTVVCYNTTNEICQYIIEVLVRGRMRFVNIPPKWYFLRYIQEMKRGTKKDVALTRHAVLIHFVFIVHEKANKNYNIYCLSVYFCIYLI